MIRKSSTSSPSDGSARNAFAEPGDQRLTPSGVADEDSQRHRDDQGDQQRDRRVQEVVADLCRDTA